jgi:hypothetical protein
VLLLRKEISREKEKALQGIFRTPIKHRKASTIVSDTTMLSAVVAPSMPSQVEEQK